MNAVTFVYSRYIGAWLKLHLLCFSFIGVGTWLYIVLPSGIIYSLITLAFYGMSVWRYFKIGKCPKAYARKVDYGNIPNSVRQSLKDKEGPSDTHWPQTAIYHFLRLGDKTFLFNDLNMFHILGQLELFTGQPKLDKVPSFRSQWFINSCLGLSNTRTSS